MTKEEAQLWDEVKQDAHDIMDVWADIVIKQPEPKNEEWPIVVNSEK